MPRVVIFSTAYFPLVGGAEIAVQEITARLPEFEFIVITARLDPRLARTEKHGSVTIHRIGNGTWLDKIRLVLCGARVAATYQPDKIWAIMASYAGFAALWFKKKNPTTPFLLTLQEGDSQSHIYARVWWCWPWFTQIFKRADYIQAISSYLAAWARRLGATCPVAVIPNGIDQKLFYWHEASERVNDEQWLKTKLSIPAEAKIVFTASRLVLKNGVGDLIAALSLLSDDLHLVIAGAGELESAYRTQVAKLGITSRVHFLGTVPYAELPRYLSASAVFCRPSVSEGLGNAFLEAMAVGTPIVGTLVGGIKDFLEAGKTGFVCEVANPKSIAAALTLALQSDTAAITVAAQSVVAERFIWNEIAEKQGVILRTL